GVEHRQHAGQRPEVTLLRTKVLERRGRDLHQQAVKQLLVAIERPAHLRRHGYDGMKIVAGQELALTLLQPLMGLASMALGARPVTAAMVAPKRVIAVVATVKPTAQLPSAASGDVPEGLLLRGHHPFCVPRRIFGTEPA